MRSIVLLAAIGAATTSFAQTADSSSSTPATTPIAPAMAIPLPNQVPAANQLVVPANTEVTVTPNDTLTSKTLRKGDVFSVSTVYDIVINNYIVIPRGTRGQGEVTWRTGKGAFGKSAKMDIELRWLDIGGKRLPIEAKIRQEGEGNTGATIGAVVAVGPFGAFVTGKSATIPAGMQLRAHTTEALIVALPNAVAAPLAVPPTATAPIAAATQGTNPAMSSTASASGN